MKTITHIDGDIIVYSVGFAANDDPIAFAKHSVKLLINRIVDRTEADEYVVHLTGKGNFRDELATIQGYKENRKDTPKPVHYKELRNYLETKYKAHIATGMEADDTMGIQATSNDGDNHVIATLDKDLNMIPCWHYNWRKDELFEVVQPDADKFFIVQLLTGDSTDNIPGLKRITGSMATKKIKEYCSEPDEFTVCIERIRETYKEKAEDIDVDSVLHEIGNLLWIRRDGYDTWESYYEECRKTQEEDT